MILNLLYKLKATNHVGIVLQRLITIFICLFFFAAAEAKAGKPAALALDVSGPTAPAIEPFSELETKSPIELAPDTTIEFLHYATCQAVTVRGGRLNFTSQRYLFKGGKILDTKRAECPKKVALSGASQIGGVVLRGRKNPNAPLKVTTRPSFVLVGAKARGFTKIQILQNSDLVLEAMLTGRVFHFPESAPTLEKGQSYEVVLTPSGGGKPRKFSLKAKGRPKKDALTLIRVD
jgi:hypothetical protein